MASLKILFSCDCKELCVDFYSGGFQNLFLTVPSPLVVEDWDHHLLWRIGSKQCPFYPCSYPDLVTWLSQSTDPAVFKLFSCCNISATAKSPQRGEMVSSFCALVLDHFQSLTACELSTRHRKMEVSARTRAMGSSSHSLQCVSVTTSFEVLYKISVLVSAGIE